ncbi:FAD/NAD-binding domain-containing protein [Cylindrobasidium torrendii FP15055 ss-10]|uniref:FAD/NAD-binding domain-containing protein n=1 Tax=Cylindrobasidium torrendii FP15055 ss-10 TaxID=1314674 RepID=A0A0D7BNH5_9AGAR|nr:FAD/NAD-binding domain-containing protein [Cylindrobasidium torrendii FP15055 ss-10]
MPKSQPRVIIIGAGLAGIAAGVALKVQLGFNNFTIFEKTGDTGGTWRDSTYPGCGCDVPAHWYSLSTELNPNWSRHYATQPELQAYWQHVFEKHRLGEQTQFHTGALRSSWDEENQRWELWVKDYRTGQERPEYAEVLIYAIGGFMNLQWPKDISGLDKFKGPLWHSAQWRHDVDLKGKRIGAVGNACSAAQFVTAIAQDPEVEVINFCRTPQWFVPRADFEYPEWGKWLFKNIPGIMRLWRVSISFRSDFSFLLFNKDRKWLVDLVRGRLGEYIRATAPPGFPIPEYPPGCNRMIVDPGYLEVINRPNVSTRWDAIESVVEEGLKMKTGEIVPLDVLIFGTGYSVDPVDLVVQGREMSSQEYFERQDGAGAFLGSSFPGFPNFFTLLGPNVATGHASVIFSEETQINLAMKLIKPVIDGKITSFAIKPVVCDEYNDWLQGRLQHSVWSECRSYYHRARDNSSKIVATFPGPVSLFWWLSRVPRWNQWEVRGATLDWNPHETRRKVVEFIFSWVVATFFAIPWGILS